MSVVKEKVQKATWVGKAVPRREDLRFVRGMGEYVDDRTFEGALHLGVVRSPYAHARILKVDKQAAEAMPGVVAVVCGEDIKGEIDPTGAALPKPYQDLFFYPLAVGKVRYAGEPVAVVVATSPYLAEDAVAAVDVDYDPLPPVVDALAAMEEDAPLVHENVPSNVVFHRDFVFGDVEAAFSQADTVVSRKLHLHRFTSAPLETRAAVGSYNAKTGLYTIFSNLQNPERYRGRIASSLKTSPTKLHFECPDIGGGFGLKLHMHWVVLLCWLSKRLGKPVKWVEDRTGHLIGSHHGNEALYDAEIAVTRAGQILGIRTRMVHDEGAYLEREPKGIVNQLRHATSVYNFKALQMDSYAVMTTKCPTGPNRSYGKVQQSFLVERLIDEAAKELHMDPLALRRKNLVLPEEMPYETPTGALYDGGDYPKAFDEAERIFDLKGFLKEKEAAKKEGRYLGWAVAAGIEATPSSSSIQTLLDPASQKSGDSEAARVRLEEDGTVTAALGTVPQGHGHETVVAQIVADELSLSPEDVVVETGYDSWRDPATPHSGTHASRFAVMGVGAVVGAARALRKKVVDLGAHLLQVSPDEVSLEGGAVSERSGRSLTLKALASASRYDLARLPEGVSPGLEATFAYHAPFKEAREDGRGNFSLTYAYAVTMVGVEVDIETGRVKVLRIATVDDCGRRLNPLITEGMIHGAVAHQVGAALWEDIRYSEDGQLLTSTFKDYLTPTASDLPHYDVGHVETPSLFSPLGARGMVEGGGTPLIATIGAVADALSSFGVTVTESHVTPDDIHSMLQEAKNDAHKEGS